MILVATTQNFVSLDGELADELMDWGAGNSNHAEEIECGLLDPAFVFTSREREALQRDAAAYRGLDLACRDELTSLPGWADLGQRATWKELAREPARRDAAK